MKEYHLENPDWYNNNWDIIIISMWDIIIGINIWTLVGIRWESKLDIIGTIGATQGHCENSWAGV
jgi:hypothetical protein